MKGILQFFKKANDILMNLESFVSSIALILILVLYFLTIVLRMVFGSDLKGMEELVMLLAVWMYMIGIGMATCKEAHVVADLIKAFLKKRRPRLIHRIWIYAVNSFICIFFLILAVKWIRFQMVLNPKSTVYRFPLLIPYCSIPFGFAFSSIYSVMHLVHALYALVTGKGNGGIPADDLLDPHPEVSEGETI